MRIDSIGFRLELDSPEKGGREGVVDEEADKDHDAQQSEGAEGLKSENHTHTHSCKGKPL